MNSILTSIKKLLGIPENNEAFDIDIIIHINASFSTLNQLGVGPESGFSIASKNETWDEYSTNSILISLVKDYIYYKVRLKFDPPGTSFGIDAFNEMAKEAEWRLNVMAEDSKVN